MSFAVPPWPVPRKDVEHPLFGIPLKSKKDCSKETDLDRAYASHRGGARPKLSPRDIELICRIIHLGLLSRNQTATLFKVTDRTISMVVHGAGQRFKHVVNVRPAMSQVSSLKIKKVQRLLKEGKTTEEIAAATRCSNSLVCQVRAGRTA